MTPRQRALAVVGIGGIVGVISSLFAYTYVQQLVSETRAEMSIGNRKTTVAVASRQLPWGSVLSGDAIRMVPFPSESLPEGYFSASEELIGRVVLAPLAPQEPILASKLAHTDVTTGGIAAITHPEKRALAIKVDDVTAVGGVLKSGDHVDVLTTMSRALNGGESVTKLVLADITVLSTGLDSSSTKEDESVVSGQKISRQPPTVVTLEVTPNQAETLSFAAMEGKVHLALRNPRSATTVTTPGVTLASLFGTQRSDLQRLSETTARQRNVIRDKPSDRSIRATEKASAHASSVESAADASTTVGALPRLQPYVHSLAPVATGVEERAVLAPPDSTGLPRLDETQPDTHPATADRGSNTIAATPVQDNSIVETAIHPPSVSVEVIRGISRTEVKF